ncbi:hypothetical protein SSX86_029693 [Deinandra increscens subsp. villosa]|uniref:UBX domain-containing protein n=1 Tax=Deinandra increscens subsp. villosa TaxID=3103831 RepID=A0AAP0CGS0_9ASTR
MSRVSEIGKALRPGLITITRGGGSGLIRLAWKLLLLPISITAGVLRLITGSVRLGFWVGAGVLSYLIGLTTFVLQQKSTSSPLVSVSPERSEAFHLPSEIENRPNRESPTAATETISLPRQAKQDQNQVEQEAESARLLEKKALSLGPEPEKWPDVTQVLVRLPNGERKGRRFHCSVTLQSVYDFVDSSGCIEVGSYTLVNFFPRVLYGEDDLSSTLEVLGLCPQASLFVELRT